jgi:hypothetical protein
MEPDPDFMDVDSDFDDAELQAALIMSLEVRLAALYVNLTKREALLYHPWGC